MCLCIYVLASVSAQYISVSSVSQLFELLCRRETEIAMSDAKKVIKSGYFKHDLEEKAEDWKSKLSAVFSHEQILFSLLVLGIFYIGYIAVHGNHDTDVKHEGDIIEGCYCKNSHRDFYHAWFAFCCALWLILHSYSYLILRFKSFGIGNILKFTKAAYIRILKSTKGSLINQSNPISKNAVICQHYIEVLWFQYYKLYVVGYEKNKTGKNEKIVLDQIMDEDDDTDNSDGKKKVTCFCFTAYIDKEVEDCDGEEQTPVKDYTCGWDEKLGASVSIMKSINRTLLLLVKFLVQAATLPLLFLQLFDSYSLLCFFSPMYLCGSSSTVAYEIHLAQAAITLLFYCCLALSLLASLMITWNPWPKADDETSEDT